MSLFIFCLFNYADERNIIKLNCIVNIIFNLGNIPQEELFFRKSNTMITVFSILGLGAIGSRLVDVTCNHSGRFPHGWGREFVEFFKIVMINTGFFIVIMLVLALVS